MLDGAGLLYERFEALKRELEEMGMFAPEYKQPIPAYVRKVGIVTAPTGAAVRDIMNIARRRNPYVQLILYPALVQGEGAVPSIIKGLRMLEQYGVDVIIAGRGGGSIEDLWAFNEEAVARAIFDCKVPVISAVGHETDTMISDFVADLRAPTPSAAAELAVYEYAACEAQRKEYELRLKRQMLRVLQEKRQELEQMGIRLRYTHPRQKLNDRRQYAADLETRLCREMQRTLEKSWHRLAIYIEKMNGLSPLKKLNQGYSYVEDSSGRTVRSVDQTKAGEMLRIYVSDGVVDAQVRDVRRLEAEERK